MVSTALFNTILLITCASENLLANPGFEEIVIDLPQRWDLYLLPRPGATGKLDDTAYAGKFSVFLHTPTPYEKEPINNWSQNIIAEFAGRTLHLSGYIKVEEAKEAALWVQCWRKRPWGVLKIVTTSTDTPVYGTKDWEHVEAMIDVPKGTDFITVRCVLLGTGSAWFDNVSITMSKPKENTDTIEDTEGSDADDKETRTSEVKPTPPIIAVSLPQNDIDRVQFELARLREANLLLAEGVQGIQSTNKELLEEILRLQLQLEQLRNQVIQESATVTDGERSRPTESNPSTPKITTTKPVPILVPHQSNGSTRR